MTSEQSDALDRLFTEFEYNEFTMEQASILCNLSMEMLDEMVEDNLIFMDEGIYTIPFTEDSPL